MTEDKTEYGIANGYYGVVTWELTMDTAWVSSNSIAHLIDETIATYHPVPSCTTNPVIPEPAP